jgi:hypothetical protein
MFDIYSAKQYMYNNLITMTVKIPNSYVTDNLVLFDELPYQLHTIGAVPHSLPSFGGANSLVFGFCQIGRIQLLTIRAVWGSTPSF